MVPAAGVILCAGPHRGRVPAVPSPVSKEPRWRAGPGAILLPSAWLRRETGRTGEPSSLVQAHPSPYKLAYNLTNYPQMWSYGMGIVAHTEEEQHGDGDAAAAAGIDRPDAQAA